MIKKWIKKANKKYMGDNTFDDSNFRICLNNPINDYRYFFKNSFFKHEEEVRWLVYISKEENRSNYNENSKLQFRTKKDYIVPYMELSISEVLRIHFENITIGPKHNFELAKNTLTRYKKVNGFDEVTVIICEDVISELG